jgi:NADH-quinone oxidoreductase subunit J
MYLPLFFFYLFASVLIGSSLCVILSRNSVHSVLFLILAFFNAAALFLFQNAEFLAMLLIIVYVGAVAMLFLFVVMMLNSNEIILRKKRRGYVALGSLVATVLLVEIAVTSYVSFADNRLIQLAKDNVVFPFSEGEDNITAIGNVLYSDFIYQFQLVGIILLAAMLGAVVLTFRQRDDLRRQKASKQVSRSRSDSVKLVKVLSGKGI